MAREFLLMVLGILSLVAYGVSQTVPPYTNRYKFRDTSDTLPVKIGIPTQSTSVSNNADGDSLPKIRDQTAQTFQKLESAISKETELLTAACKAFKPTMTEALKNLSKTELDIGSISNEMNIMSTTVDTVFAAADKRLRASLLTVGRSLNSTIASFVKSEQGYIVKMKLSPDARSISKALRQVEKGLYHGLGTCVRTFNDTVVSDIFTARNILNTYFMVNGVANCSAPAKCAALSRTHVLLLHSWRILTTSTFNKIPNSQDLNTCITRQVTTARNDLENLGSTIQPPVDSTAVIANHTAMLEVNANKLFGNFSNNVQKLVNGVVQKNNHMQTFAGRHTGEDPKSIIDTRLKTLATADDVTTELMETILPRLTAISRTLIVPLLNNETKIQGQIETTLAKNDASSSECDAAIQTIHAIKTTFNNSMATCFKGAQNSMDAILTATIGMINKTLIEFTTQITSAEQFDCGRSCTITAMQAFAEQLKSKLRVGATLLVELPKSVAEQSNRVITSFELCMYARVVKALGDLKEQNNGDIKRCLAEA